MIGAVLAARRHETSLAFERIRMQAGALFAVGHGHAEVPTRRTRSVVPFGAGFGSLLMP
jgi:hypothetical protein